MKQEWLEGHKARKRFGQNFLHDRHWIERIVRGIDPKPGDALIEIGPGQAALTREVIACAGHEAAVEIDRDLAQFLREQFSPEELTLIEADALKLDWTTVLEGRRLRIIGNLPYNISSPLLFALMSAADRVIDQHFMLQREVVDRMVAEPGSKTYGQSERDAPVPLRHAQALRRAARRLRAAAQGHVLDRTHGAAPRRVASRSRYGDLLPSGRARLPAAPQDAAQRALHPHG